MRKTLIGALILAGLAVTPAMSATELRTSSGFGPNHVNAEGYKVFLKKLEELSGGSITGQDFPSGLVSPAEMVSGLQSGMVDVGSVLMPYFPAEFLEANLPSELALIGTNGRASSAASLEYILTCQECLAEFERAGEVYLAGSATPAYQLLTLKPVRDTADLTGLRIRTGGAAFTRWAEAMGAIPVQLPAPEIFEAMSQGVVQAHYNTPQDLKSYNLFEIVKSITLINQGTFNGVSPFSIRADLWSGLSPEERKQFVEAAQYGAAAILYRFEDSVKASLEKAKADGIEIIEPSQKLVEANKAFVEKDLKELPKRLTEKGIKDAEAKIARYQALVEKWNGLIQDGTTEEAYVALLKSEIWDKIDLAKYPN